MKLKKMKLFKEIKSILGRWGFSKQGIFQNTKGEWYLFSQMFLIIIHLLPPYPKIENIEFSINIFFVVIGLVVSISIKSFLLLTFIVELLIRLVGIF